MWPHWCQFGTTIDTKVPVPFSVSVPLTEVAADEEEAFAANEEEAVAADEEEAVAADEEEAVAVDEEVAADDDVDVEPDEEDESDVGRRNGILVASLLWTAA